jgi:hypothetical protein
MRAAVEKLIVQLQEVEPRRASDDSTAAVRLRICSRKATIRLSPLYRHPMRSERWPKNAIETTDRLDAVCTATSRKSRLRRSVVAPIQDVRKAG